MKLERLQAVKQRVPFFRFLDLSVVTAEDSAVVTFMPFHERHIGHPALENFHGGTVASFMEATASLCVCDHLNDGHPKPINLTVDYLRPARPMQLNARATVSRRGRRMASIEVVAWQDSTNKPVAKGLFHFLLV